MYSLLSALAMIFALNSEVLCVCNNYTTVVSTTSGQLVGCRLTQVIDGKTYSWKEFLGIPYAAPPLGQQRFKKTVAAEPWNGTLNATQFGKMCIQFDSGELTEVQGEDCLTLNLFVPSKNVSRRSAMVFVHGGLFSRDSSQNYNGSMFATVGDVILVTLNYRLGPLGFLSTGDSVVPGNMGMWDVLEALKWLNKNLAFFGGDPLSVTVFGQSAGSMLLANLLTSTQIDTNLTQRAILESGSFLTSVRNNKQTLQLSRDVANTLGCPTGSSDDMLSCLARIPIQLLRNKTPQTGSRFLPVTDGYLLTRDCCSIVVNFTKGQVPSATKLAQFDVIVGHNSQEGLFYYNTVNTLALAKEGRNASEGLSEAVFTQSMDTVLGSLTAAGAGPSLLITAVKFNYEQRFADVLMNKTNDEKRLKWATEIYADVAFVWPAIATAILHQKQASGRKTYFYVFDLPSTSYKGPDWLKSGASHGDELSYVFGSPILLNMSGSAKNLSTAMIGYWSSFAKSGNPSSSWLPFTSAKEYVTISAGGLKNASNPAPAIAMFWNVIQSTACQLDNIPILPASTTAPPTPNTSPASLTSLYGLSAFLATVAHLRQIIIAL